jgi:hypothetical protein
VAMAAVSASVGQADSGLRAAVQAASTTTLRRVLTEYECCPIASTAGDDAADVVFLWLLPTPPYCAVCTLWAPSERRAGLAIHDGLDRDTLERLFLGDPVRHRCPFVPAQAWCMPLY